MMLNSGGSNYNQMTQQNDVPLTNAMDNGVDLPKKTSSVTAAAAFVSTQPPPPLAANNVVNLFSITMSSPPACPCPAASAPVNAVASMFDGLKAAGGRSRSSPSPNRQQKKYGNGNDKNGGGNHRRAVQQRKGHGGGFGGVAEALSDVGNTAAATTTTTIRYNYAHRKDCSEKTPMCRLAEMARANHLKHEYVLLDECGPAHCKQFTVKLVLCPGHEFEGSGASIKKAQQSAAQVAIDRWCQLPLRQRQPMPPSLPQHYHRQQLLMLHDAGGGGVRRSVAIRRDDPKNPICLLHSVASQLGIGLQYRQECLNNNEGTRSPLQMPSSSLANLPPPFLAYFLPHALCHPPSAALLNGVGSLPAPQMFANLPPQPHHRQQTNARLQPPPPVPFGSSPIKGVPPPQPPPGTLSLTATAMNNAHQNTGAPGLLPNPLILPPPPPSTFHQSIAMPPPPPNPLSAAASMLCHPSVAAQMHHHHHHTFLPPFPSLPPPAPNGRVNNNSCNSPFALLSQHHSASSNAQNYMYKVTVRLSNDGTEHVGIGPTFMVAKHKAATAALAHLRPELERLKRQRDAAEEEEADNNHQQQQQLLDEEEEEQMAMMMPKLVADAQAMPPQNDGIGTHILGAKVAVLSCSPPTLPAAPAALMASNAVNRVEQQSRQDEHQQKSSSSSSMIRNTNDVDECCEMVAEEDEQSSAAAAASSKSACKKPHKKYKSVVSQIHECALQLRMNVEFEMVAEHGEPHNRIYTVSVRLISPSSASSFVATDRHNNNIINSIDGRQQLQQQQREFVADGQGLSKKAAKQAACQKLLGQVKHLLELDPIQLASSIVHPAANGGPLRRAISLGGGEAANAAQQKAEAGGTTKRRTIIKDVKIDPNYGTGVNPISRLIQVMQARGEPDPQFRVIGEHGQNRHKEFTVSVQCMGGLLEQGTGPNKKLAKRAAAEVMLAKIGYVKPMPQPGKSLLKKSSSSTISTTMEDNNYNYCIDNIAGGSALSSPEKVAAPPSSAMMMPIIDMFVVPEEFGGAGAGGDQQEAMAAQCTAAEEEGTGIIGRSHQPKMPLLAQQMSPTADQATLATFADVEQQCFSTSNEHHYDDEQQMVQSHPPVSVPPASINVPPASISVPQSSVHGDRRLEWVNPPSLDQMEDDVRNFDGHDEFVPPPPYRSADSSPSAELSSSNNNNSPSPADDDMRSAAAVQRRRVTFSDTVRACPPPGATEAASEAPLKSELCTKPKRRLRPFSKDSQRVLSMDETKRLMDAATLFLAWPSVEAEKCGLTLLNTTNALGGTTGNGGGNIVDDHELLGAALRTLGIVGMTKSSSLIFDKSEGDGTGKTLLMATSTTTTGDGPATFTTTPVLDCLRSPVTVTPLNNTRSNSLNLFASAIATESTNSSFICPPLMSTTTATMVPPAGSISMGGLMPRANSFNFTTSSPDMRMMPPAGNINNSMTSMSSNSLNLTASTNGLRTALSANSLNNIASASWLLAAENLNALNSLNLLSSPPSMVVPPPTLPPSAVPTMFPVPPPPATPSMIVPPPAHFAAASMPPPSLFETSHNVQQQQKFALVEAKPFLEQLATVYSFTVVYSDFPKTRNDANEEQCFSLVTLGFAKPIVCHGSGHTKQIAHNDAALNAVRKCSQLIMAPSTTTAETVGRPNK